MPVEHRIHDVHLARVRVQAGPTPLECLFQAVDEFAELDGGRQLLPKLFQHVRMEVVTDVAVCLLDLEPRDDTWRLHGDFEALVEV